MPPDVLISKMNLILLLFFLYLHQVSGETGCNFNKCGDCIVLSAGKCIWCSEIGIEDRCQPVNVLNSTKNWCKPELIENPQPHKHTDKPKEFGTDSNGTVIQFKPQVMRVSARPKIPVSFTMSYRPADDYPLDVYYLMDASYTMMDHVDNLRKQAEDIYKGLTALTNNVQLGVGSFIEKPAYPYVDFSRGQKSFTFKNTVPLTKNMTLFRDTINNIKSNSGSNNDDPEAGLDALMQVMTCDNAIGWRNNSRRIIVLCTDNTYHSAGDGKMLGIIRPNDMKCHLENDIYNQTSLYTDYPSVSEINYIATKENFLIIFAIADGKRDCTKEYKALVKQINTAQYSQLGKGTVVDMIKKVYLSSVRHLSLRYETSPPNIDMTLTFDPDCSTQEKEKCEITASKPTVDIQGTLTINSCLDDKKEYRVKIGPHGLKDALVININTVCKCNCEELNSPITPKCSNAGFIQCGICKCNVSRYGSDCRCSGDSTDMADIGKCQADNSSYVCSDKGHCSCGECYCKDGYSGDYCEFNDKACPRADGKLCSNRGTCRRGKCNCEPEWSGDDCQCPLHNRDCIAPHSKTECSGNGVCKCGICQCNKQVEGKDESYSGVFCDACAECVEKRCKELEDYAHCNFENMENKTICDERYNITDSIIFFVNKTEINDAKWFRAKWCRKLLEDGNKLVFKYTYDEHDLVLVILKETEAPPKANIWVAVGSAIGSVLLIGLLTVLIWKIFINMHDAKEFKKFQSEAAAAGYDTSLNPLYQSPQVNFGNPTYDGGN